MNDKDEIPIAINEHFSVRGRRIIIPLRKLSGFGRGDVYGQTLCLATAPLVKKETDGYALLNYGDPRVARVISKYDSDTKVEVVIVPDNHAEAVAFMSGELIPQITPDTKFADFFISLSRNPQKQELVRDYFTKQASRDKAKLAFNLKRFITDLGVNSPTITTASKLLRNALDEAQKDLEAPTPKVVVIDPPAIDSKQDIAVEDKVGYGDGVVAGRVDSTSDEVTTSQLQDNESLNELEQLHEQAHSNESFIDSLCVESTKTSDVLTHIISSLKSEGYIPTMGVKELRQVWGCANSNYSFDDVVERFQNRENYLKVFVLRLCKIKPGTLEFDTFKSKLEEELDGQRSAQ